MTQQEKTYRVRFKRSNEDYKTARVDGNENLDYNTSIKVMNKLKEQNIASWLFEEGNKKPVVQWIPNSAEEIQL